MAKNTITDGEILKKELREIREKEFAIENEEISEGLCCISAPIKNHEGEIIAAISMSIPTIRFNDEREKIIVKELKKTVLEISKQLGLQNSKT
jgi:DNA-binding IclR family transcriptional regulator